MIKVIEWVNETNKEYGFKLDIIIENNNSMTNKNKELIYKNLQSCFEQPIFKRMLNGADFGVQTRRRIYWTTFQVNGDIKCVQEWEDVLEPIEKCIEYVGKKHILNTGNKIISYKGKTQINTYQPKGNNIWTKIISNQYGKSKIQYASSSTEQLKSAPIVSSRNIHSIVIDNRNKEGYIIRFITGVEAERLFFIPDGWVSNLCSKTRCLKLLGNTVIVKVIEFILKSVNNR